MDKVLRYTSISHKKANVLQREVYHISEEEKIDYTNLIRNTFQDISGLFLLATCNRTEIYFESSVTMASTLRDFLIGLKVPKVTKTNQQLFQCCDLTENTVKHLLEVSSGLESSVLGDAEIIHQIKKAHQFSIALQLQGSLLERAMQAVFKNHKRISNETRFRDGTTSVAYKSLKVINHTFEKASAKEKKILFIGAGEIVNQLFKYNSKFNFKNIYISNRTEERAQDLSKINQCQVFEWKKVMANNFQDFDVIISAASNCPNLIKKIQCPKQKVLLIDLAVPGNIDKKLAKSDQIIFYDLDSISAELENTKKKRNSSIIKVNEIIAEELSTFTEWLQNAPLRELLAEYKIAVNKKVADYLNALVDDDEIEIITNQVMRKIMNQPATLLPLSKIDDLILEQIPSLDLTKYHN